MSRKRHKWKGRSWRQLHHRQEPWADGMLKAGWVKVLEMGPAMSAVLVPDEVFFIDGDGRIRKVPKALVKRQSQGRLLTFPWG